MLYLKCLLLSFVPTRGLHGVNLSALCSLAAYYQQDMANPTASIDNPETWHLFAQLDREFLQVNAFIIYN